MFTCYFTMRYKNVSAERYGDAYIAEAIACSENGNHATIYAVGITADEANDKLIEALRELKLLPEPSMKDER